MIRQTFRIKGMHCANCAMAIDMEVEDTPIHQGFILVWMN